MLDENASIITVATVSIRKELSLSRILMLLNVFPFASGLCFAFIPIHLAALRWTLTALFALLTLAVTTYIAICCHEITSTRFVLERDGYGTPGRRRFRTPLVPWLPALGIYMNWFMLANVGWVGIVMLIGYLFLGVFMYGAFCSGKSIVTSNENDDGQYKNQSILPSGRLSPTLANPDLQQALLEDDNDGWDGGREGRSGNLRKDLSEIETSKRQFV